MDDEYWVFGYGSLIWKVDFPIERRIAGYIKGYLRRFWQGSHDHRGTELNPGRVVTLVPEVEWRENWREADETAHPGDEIVCWGVAYKVRKEDAEEVRRHLDFREKNGYATYVTDVFHPEQREPIVKGATIYIASTDNHAFLGPKPLIEMARQIAITSGPSGRNLDYFLNLCKAVRVIAPHQNDPHLDDLERAVRSVATDPNDDVDLRDLIALEKASHHGLVED
ncbi:ChaC, cation transport regulator 2 [Chytridium lagenaria]|nr:ChaC, cation transport regulator 2 [Chytridium lagenaria]